MKKQEQAGIYLRWSNDDGREIGEAISIGTQRQLLMKFAKENGISVTQEYLDDGFSGTSFDRPGFQHMLADIEDGKINCVLVKDMSRFGRNHVMVDMYVQMVFPEKGVRLISVGDNYDSAKGESELLPFMSIVNEYFARDISKKLTSAHRVHAQQGQFLGRFAPYGYIKDPNDKHHLLVDEEAAETVRNMYKWFAGGMSYGQIVKRLHDEQVPNPVSHSYRKYGKALIGKSCDYLHYPYNWHRGTVQHILTDPLYLGHMYSLKTARLSFAVKKRVKRSREEQVVVYNTHEGLIDQATFDAVQRFASLKQRVNKAEQANMYKGILRCADCGCSMGFNSTKGTGFYRCSRYRYGKTNLGMFEPCTQHHTSLLRLNAFILAEINKMIDALGDPIAMAALLKDSIPDDTDSQKKTLEKLKRRDAELKLLVKKVFEQNTLGVIDDATFSDLYEGYKAEQKASASGIAKLEAELAVTNKQEIERMRLYGIIESFHGQHLTELTRETLTALIERIDVHEPVGPKYMKDKPQTYYIKWRFLS